MNDVPPETIPGAENADLGSRISRTVSIYASHPVPFLSIAVLQLPISLFISFWEWGWLLWLPQLVVGEVVSAALVFAAFRVVTKYPPTFSESYKIALARLGDLVEYLFRYFGAATLLFITIIGIPWAIRLFVRWFFGTQGVILYGDSAKEAISRSCRLADSNWWRIFGHLLLALVAGLVALPLAFAGGVVPTVIGAIWGIVAAPFLTIFWILLFLRLAQEKGEPTPTATSEVYI